MLSRFVQTIKNNKKNIIYGLLIIIIITAGILLLFYPKTSTNDASNNLSNNPSNNDYLSAQNSNPPNIAADRYLGMSQTERIKLLDQISSEYATQEEQEELPGYDPIPEQHSDHAQINNLSSPASASASSYAAIINGFNKMNIGLSQVNKSIDANPNVLPILNKLIATELNVIMNNPGFKYLISMDNFNNNFSLLVKTINRLDKNNIKNIKNILNNIIILLTNMNNNIMSENN